MFITTEHRHCIELNSDDGQLGPTLVHCFSDHVDPFKTVNLPVYFLAIVLPNVHLTC